jgi:hypothetical protein
LGPLPPVALNKEERNVATGSSDEFLTAQATDDTCQRILLQTFKTHMYELNKDGLLVRVSPVDGSQQAVEPQNQVPRILYMENYPHQRAIREHIACSKPFVVPLFGRGSPKASTKPLESATFAPETALRRRRNQPSEAASHEWAAGISCDGYTGTTPANQTW